MCLFPARPPSAPRRQAARGPVCARGLSLVELILFIVIVGAALAGTLAVFVQSTRASADPMQRAQALAVARSLLEEVQLAAFTWCDPDDANAASATSAAGCASLPEALGPEAGESRLGSPGFDNVNDYDGYAMNGIVDLSNTAIPGLAGYAARVRVAAAALGSIGAAGDALRITVTVTSPNGASVTLEGWRTRHAPDAAL